MLEPARTGLEQPLAGVGRSAAVAEPVAFSSGFFFVNPFTLERELLANNLDWQAVMPPDSTLQRQIVLGSVTSDTNGDGVDDKAFSTFRVTAFDFSLRFYLEQQVESTGNGTATLTQSYAVINELGNYVDFNLVRHLDADLERRTASVEIPGILKSSGRPMINEFNGEPFHVALARPSGSFEFTYAEIGLGSTTVTGDMDMAFEDSWAHFCVHHFDQDGLVRERSRLTAWLDA